MDLYLARKTALITGATKGIGRAVATLFAEEGASLLLVSRSAIELDALAVALRDQHEVAISVCAADVSTSYGRAKVESMANKIDVLINNAGSVPPGSLLTLDEDTWRAAWELKVFGYIDLARRLYPTLQRRRGVIVNIIGTSGERAEPNYIAGSSGNAALMAFTRGLGSNSPRDGVRVVGVNPGPVATERIETLLRARAERSSGDGDTWQNFYEGSPFGRAATPEEIANAVVFLASSRSSYTSGTILTIDDPARASL